MSSTRATQQAHRDAINIQRMLSRLEVATEEQQQQPSSSYTTSKEYYKTLSTLSSIRIAEKLLKESVTDEKTQSDVARRLAKLESYYQHVLANTPKPHTASKMPSLEHLRPVIPAELGDSTTEEKQETGNNELDITDASVAVPTPEIEAANALLPLGGDDMLDDGGGNLHRRRSSLNTVSDTIGPLSSTTTYGSNNTGKSNLARNSSSYTKGTGKKDTPNDTQSLSNLLSHHRSEQETLTEELANMASRLKMNSLEFSQLLEKDKSLLEKADEQLDGNLSGMIKERDRLKDYKKTGGVTTWFVIGSVLAVLFAWLFMFALMRIF